ncbi:MAG: (d)CMP kinase [Cytophagia bacterium]|nr:(d)CMP kinase [Cytophagia bacterium]
MKALVIAVDGYASCGKSTLARDLAQTLDYRYIDSGAMYRAVTYRMLQLGLPLTESPELDQLLQTLDLKFIKSEGVNQLIINGMLLGTELRTKAVNAAVSPVSTLPSVRRAMVVLQRSYADGTGLTMDGRDIGTYVFPQADLKIFVTARPEIRAIRRQAELIALGDSTWTLDEILQNQAQRDRIDSNRDFAPLKRAEDAVDLDNSDLSREEQLAWALKWVEERGGV